MVLVVSVMFVYVRTDKFYFGGIESMAVEGNDVRDCLIVVNHGGKGCGEAGEVVFHDEVDETVPEFRFCADGQEVFLDPGQGVFRNEIVYEFSAEKYEVGHSFVLKEAADRDIGTSAGVRIDCGPDDGDLLVENVVF